MGLLVVLEDAAGAGQLRERGDDHAPNFSGELSAVCWLLGYSSLRRGLFQMPIGDDAC
jgi:hypothetical protein